MTAQKRKQNLQDVPISVTAMTGPTLQASGVMSTGELATVTPGLVITDEHGAPAVFIRGIGTQNTFVGEESSNATYVDGIYYASLASSTFRLSSVDRIEILKGPQGTLFGRNATGGLIQVITKDVACAKLGDF